MFFDRLKQLCDSKGISIYKAATAIGLNRSSATKWKTGAIPNGDTLSALAKYFSVPVGFLLCDGSDGVAPPSPSTWIPVLGRVQAGIPMDAVEEIIGYEEISETMARQGEYFALQVRGQSMEPRILEGDVVIVQKQEDAETGDIAVVLVNGDEATIKRIKKRPEGLMLIPLNPAFEPMFYSAEDVAQLPVRIIGKVVELRGKF